MITKKVDSRSGLSILVLFSMLLGLLLPCEVMAAAYKACNIPPVVGSASRPNVLLVNDYSGSMQFPAYYADAYNGYYGNKTAINYSDSVYKAYNPQYSYYGTFESDQYYVYVPTPTGASATLDYFKLATPQPVTSVNITTSADGGGDNSIIFTAPGHTFQVNDLVAFYDLTSHLGLNYNAFPVTAISGDTFTVQATALNALKWSGKADTAGKAVKRIDGSLIPNAAGNAPGVSGNVLNFAITTRVDAALKALIGGRAICPECTYNSNGALIDGNHDYFLRPQGGRRRVQDVYNSSSLTTPYLNADFYVRPATIESSTAYPNDYNTGSNYYKDDSDHDRDIFVTIKGRYAGQLSAAHPVYYGKYFELWTFTLEKRTRVELVLDGLWPGNDYVSIYTQPLVNNGDNNGSQIYSSQANPASISQELDAGTYYVRATHSDQSLDPSYRVAYWLSSNVNLKPYVVTGFAHNGQVLTKIGSLPWGRARLKLEPDSSGKHDTRNGVIQKSFPYVRFGFEYFNSSSGKMGKIAVGCENTDLSLLINAFEGITRTNDANVDFTQIYPYNGTPTGEALTKAQQYFAQTGGTTYADNTKFIDKGKAKDPYYTTNTVGTNVPVPCRKSIVILVSDGEWNGTNGNAWEGVDPVTPAYAMHTTDLRSDVTDSQTVNVYSIYAFSQVTEGKNAMKTVAMYGGFKDIQNCGTAKYPFGEDGMPSGLSLDFSWPRSACNPSKPDDTGTSCTTGADYYHVKGCSEWNATWDRDKDGVNESKGLPDSYFQADDGKQLEDSLAKVMQDVTTGNAAASAVATVSQEMRSEDVIVRGVFQAADPDTPEDFLWKGHLEAYFPYTLNGETVYDFDPDVPNNFYKASDPDLSGLCVGLAPANRDNCWDAGEILKNQLPVAPAARNIYTWLKNATSGKYEQKTFDTTNMLPATLGVTTDAERNDIVNWVRGDYISGSRNRNGWILGDIVYSTPVVIGPPKLGNVSKRDPNIHTYQVFLDDQAKRPKVVYVGANDGMLHAFLMGTTTDGTTWAQKPKDDPEIGSELWAYIPSNLLTELKELKAASYGTRTGTSPCTHRSMVDLAARHWEVYIQSAYCGSKGDSNKRCWRSVIIGGERGGGDVYFAIDVTNPVPDPSDPNSGPKVLWEYSALKNRIVVESDTTTCMQSCRNACTTTCTNGYTTCYNDCCAAYGASGCNTKNRRNTCKNKCTTEQTKCQTDCEATCVSNCANAGYKAYVPFRDAYDSSDYKIKLLPMSWSQPYLGRIHIPESVKFYYGDPNATTKLPENLIQFAAGENNREVVFMGGGIHIYDKSFTTSPAIDDRFKLALFWPNLMMIDIETGYNLFEYVWPVILNYNVTTFPNQTVGTNTIPYAMSDVLALDLWDQVNEVMGDDGFIDRVYVGDMNGYFYGIKFNLAENFPDLSTTNTQFGVQVDIWPTKPISTTDQPTNDYRSALQPITISPVASVETLPARAPASTVPDLRVIFGTGKYDDIIYGEDDKTDTTKMALYNLKDPIRTTVGSVHYGLPVIGSSAKEVFDSSHPTNFKVQIVPKCGLASSSITTFNTDCHWDTSGKITDDTSNLFGLYRGDCCEYSNTQCTGTPCYHCIYDFRQPCLKSSTAGACPAPTDAADWPDNTPPGERVLGKPLIAGGMVFVTTFVPPFDACAYTGRGYLYVFDYMCQPFPKDYNPFPGEETTIIPSASGGSTNPSGFIVGLGAGLPSRPVIDSRGENVIIQMSDGTLKRLPTDLGMKRPLQFKGWRER